VHVPPQQALPLVHASLSFVQLLAQWPPAQLNEQQSVPLAQLPPVATQAPPPTVDTQVWLAASHVVEQQSLPAAHALPVAPQEGGIDDDPPAPVPVPVPVPELVPVPVAIPVPVPAPIEASGSPRLPPAPPPASSKATSEVAPPHPNAKSPDRNRDHVVSRLMIRLFALWQRFASGHSPDAAAEDCSDVYHDVPHSPM